MERAKGYIIVSHGQPYIEINRDGSFKDGKRHSWNEATVFDTYNDAYNFKKRLARIIVEDDILGYRSGYISKEKRKEYLAETLDYINVIRLV